MGYDAAAWSDFAVAVAGAAAALSGLLFVAVSINLQPILSNAHLPERAAQALITLVMPLLVSVFLLIPGQTRYVLGAELAVLGVVAGSVLTRLNRPGTRSPQEQHTSWLIGRLLPSIATAVLLVAAGVTYAAQAGGGLYWVAPYVLFAFLAGLSNAWVLLVEILR